MSAIRFAELASEFEEWAERGTDTGVEALRNALLHFTRLYLAGLQLTEPDADQERAEDDARRENHEEVIAMPPKSRLPIDSYNEVYDPHRVPHDDVVTGSLADDFGDIFKDVVRGLRLYQAGWPATAQWHWRYHFWFHWGEHATSAIRAIHKWLTIHS